MISTTRPSRDSIDAVLETTRGTGNPSALTYAEVGATADRTSMAALPDRYTIDRRRFALGPGQPLFEAASRALFAWRHFEIPWLELHGGAGGVQEGTNVATLTRFAGLWFLNPCRVVYCSAPSPDAPDACFAYGTLTGHGASGEERFSLFLDPASECVTFEILAFSRPASALFRVGRPLLRRIQRRFALDSALALARACNATRVTEVMGA